MTAGRRGPVSLALLFVVVSAGSSAGCSALAPSDYRLSITTDKDQYAVNELIIAFGELTYLGSQPTVDIQYLDLPGGPIMFGVRQVGGSIDAVPEPHAMCSGTQLERGQPLRVPFTKFGGWNNADPNAAFYESYFKDPELHLPAGQWEVYAMIDLGGKGCEGPTAAISARTRISVN